MRNEVGQDGADLRESMLRFALLTQTAERLLRSTSPQEEVESLCRQVMQHLDCDLFVNFLADHETHRLRLNACAGVPEQDMRRLQWLDYGVAVCGCVGRDGRPIVAEHIPTTPDPRTELVKSYGVKAYACHPLLAPGGKVLGTLSFGTRKRETLRPEDLSLMKAIADQVAAALVRMEYEHSLVRTAEELQRSNQELEQFAYVASHDLQEPLRMVTAFMGLLAERYRDGLDPAAQQYIAFAREGATRMTQLVRDLLEYSRPQGPAPRTAPVDMNGVVHEAIDGCRSAIDDAGAEVTFDALPTVYGERRQLVQLMQNLLSNAVKFRRPGLSPRVHVSARAGAGQWTLCVRDNGIGIPEHGRERVFKIFQRMHSRQEYPGTGMGLAICKRIVERHGGRIWVEPAPGEGSCFFFTLSDHEPEVPFVGTLPQEQAAREVN